MDHRPTRSASLFLLSQITVIAGLGYGLSYTPIGPHTLLWLIFVSVVWIGLLLVYILRDAVDRVVDRLDTISKHFDVTPQGKVAD